MNTDQESSSAPSTRISHSAGAEGHAEETKPNSVWDDPTVPVGNAPPRSSLPVVAWALAWTLWIVFLAAMAFA
ncbi:MAG: hypothetical protein J5J06_00540 [Phycisphaerae bacterium]|nr:hypothetical protein [Phycisphaerae bacterium]